MAQKFSPEEYLGRALGSDESVEVPGVFTRLYNDEMHSMIIAVDGASRDRDSRSARAALGIFFGNNSPWNKSELLPPRIIDIGCPELCAVLRTLRLLQTDIVHEWCSSITTDETLNRVIIKTKSDHMVQNMTEHIFEWAERAYIRPGKPKIYQELYGRIADMILTLDREKNLKVLFWSVGREHIQDANRLANAPFNGHPLWDYRVGDEGYDESDNYSSY
ncbi:hypothetical protein SLS62_005777 [Diatrype stigma]|uniref:Uncharacterized protein n=1 Tax=Diatrype stigma TaxID=117547 RepID=A0AAN9V2A5_9PEZI